MAKATWKPRTEHGKLSTREQDKLPSSAFAFPKERKEPLTDRSHVRNALARFDQVKGVSEAERSQAFANIKKAARFYGLDVEEKGWHALGTRPHTANKAHRRSTSHGRSTSHSRSTSHRKSATRR